MNSKDVAQAMDAVVLAWDVNSGRDRTFYAEATEDALRSVQEAAKQVLDSYVSFSTRPAMKRLKVLSESARQLHEARSAAFRENRAAWEQRSATRVHLSHEEQQFRYMARTMGVGQAVSFTAFRRATAARVAAGHPAFCPDAAEKQTAVKAAADQVMKDYAHVIEKFSAREARRAATRVQPQVVA
jgi:hypothetical protein